MAKAARGKPPTTSSGSELVTLKERVMGRAVLAASLAVGLVAGSGVAWGYWTTSATSAGIPTIESGTFDLRVSQTDPTPSATDFEGLAGADGSFSWDAFNISGLYPNESYAQSLAVANAGAGDHAGMNVTVAVSGSLSGFADGDLLVTAYSGGTASNPSAAAGARRGTCSGTALNSTPVAVTGALTNVGTFSVPPLQASTLCVVVTVSGTMAQPTSDAPPTANLSFTLSADQTYQP